VLADVTVVPAVCLSALTRWHWQQILTGRQEGRRPWWRGPVLVIVVNALSLRAIVDAALKPVPDKCLPLSSDRWLLYFWVVRELCEWAAFCAACWHDCCFFQSYVCHSLHTGLAVSHIFPTIDCLPQDCLCGLGCRCRPDPILRGKGVTLCKV